MAEWKNWAGNVTAHPRRVVAPSDRDGLVALVQESADAGRTVRAVGAGHSFTPIAVALDTQVRLDAFDGIVHVDPETHRVRVGAGTRLYDLVTALAEHGLALPNMGDIDRQTIAGAVSTSTHGTGLAWAGFADIVVGGELVTGTGEVLSWSEGGENGDLASALGVTLGALGILTQIELQCVPAFTLRAEERPSTLTAELASLDETLTQTDHYEFFWFPHTDKVMTKRNTRGPGDAERSPLPRWKYALEDQFLSNTVFEVVNRVCLARPGLTRHVNRVSATALSARQFTDHSHTVYASPRTVKFRESEMSLPLEAAEPVLRELQTWVERTNEPVAFPVEVRWSAADDRWLSTAYGRASCYIAVHQYHRQAHSGYFPHFWQVAREHGARAHWGKMHDFDAAYLRTVYPRFDDFLALRERFDPHRVFANPHLEQVLGA